jgi:DNA-binding CsgD family transcriptional regulator
LEPKERQMLELLAGGASTRVIAKKMSYSEGTVRVYLHNLYKKLGVKNRTEALLWQLDHVRVTQERAAAPVPRSAAPLADESFGDAAVREGLLAPLGIMESFTGPYGRVWEVAARLKGQGPDDAALAARAEARTLWRTLLQGNFSYGKTLVDQGAADGWAESSPADAVLLACLLILGGYSHAADGWIAQLGRARKGARAAWGREVTLVRALREAIYAGDDEAVGEIHRLATERSSNVTVKQLAIVSLFHVYRHRRDAARARDTANVLWHEAESARRDLEAMGVRPLSREASLPRPGKVARGVREKVAAGS